MGRPEHVVIGHDKRINLGVAKHGGQRLLRRFWPLIHIQFAQRLGPVALGQGKIFVAANVISINAQLWRYKVDKKVIAVRNKKTCSPGLRSRAKAGTSV